MRTPTIYNTVHPVWNACYFELSLGSLEEAVDGNGCYSRHRSESGGTDDRFRWRSTKGDIGRGQGSALTLLIEVCDEDEGAGTGFLGQLAIGAEGLLKMAKGRQNLELPLEGKSGGNPTKKQERSARGSIGLRLLPATEEALSVLHASVDATKVFLEVTIHQCSRLHLGGGACLFAVVTLDGRDIAATPAIPNCSNPVWMETVHVQIDRDRLRLPPDKKRGSRQELSSATAALADFNITVWDRGQHESRSHRHQSEIVGRVNLSIHQLVAFADKDGALVDRNSATTERCELPLKNARGNRTGGVLVFTVRKTSPTEWRAAVTRAASLQASLVDAAGVEALCLPSVFARRVRLTVLRATGLVQAHDAGTADPMCILRRRGREVGRTMTVYGSLDPIWGGESQKGESFLLTIPHPREASLGGGGLAIEVFHDDFGDAGNFLGQVVVSGNDFLRFHSPGTFKGSEAQSVEAELQKKPEIPLSDQWLVRGMLFYTLEGVDEGEENPIDVVTEDGDASSVGERARPIPRQRSQYRNLEIRIMEARGLGSSDRFGVSGPYVVVRANRKKQLGRTRSVPSSLEPAWTDPEERFVVAVGREKAARFDLTLEVWDDDNLGKGDFLGQVSLPKEELLELDLPTGPVECDLEKNADEDDYFNKLVQGVLTFSVREAHGDMPDEPRDRESVGEVLLTVLSAKGLAKVDYFVESDPFAVVLLNRREIGRTRTMFKTLNPVWSKPRETFSVRVTDNRHRSSVVVQLWDNNLGEQGDFLGEVALGWRDLDLLEGQTGRDLDLALGERGGAMTHGQKNVRGTIQLHVETPAIKKSSQARSSDGAARSYVVTVKRAWGLQKVHPGSKSDPFVSVKVNGDEDDAKKGQTRAIPRTSNPVWEYPPEVFILTAVEEMKFEVWDANLPSEGGLLGEARLTKHDLNDGVPVDGTHDFTLTLGPKESVPKINRLSQGFLRLTCQDWMSPDRLVSEGLGERLKLTVVSASNLPRHHFGRFSTLARVRWNGLEVGRTCTVNNTSPFWNKTFQISVPLEKGHPEVKVVIEVLDAGAGEAATVPSYVMRPNNTLLATAELGTPDLQLPGPVPQCKVVELPLELPALPSANIHSSANFQRQVLSVSTIFIILESPSVPYNGRDSANEVALSAAGVTSQDVDLETRERRAAEDSPQPNTKPKMIHLKVLRADGLSCGAKGLDAFVTVRACGRDAGSTRVSTIRGTTSAEWIDEQFALLADTCRELWLEVWGRKRGNRDTFLGRATLRCTAWEAEDMARRGEPQGLPLHRKSSKIVPLADQGHVGGRLLFVFLPWREFDYSGEMVKSNANRGLQVQLLVISAANLSAPTASVFATFSFGGTEVSRTSIVAPLAGRFANTIYGAVAAGTGSRGTTRGGDTLQDLDAHPMLGLHSGMGMASHTWPTGQDSMCTFPLPEECWERREVEIEIDLWEDGGQKTDRGKNLGQVRLSGDFVPHILHGAVISRPLRPPRVRGRLLNSTARGSLSVQLWLRRGGENLASEFVNTTVMVETLAVKGLPHAESRGHAFCIVKEDKREIGRTQPSPILPAYPAFDVAPATLAGATAKDLLTGRASWEDSGTRFMVTKSKEREGSLPLELAVEVCGINNGKVGVDGSLRGGDIKNTRDSRFQLIGTVTIGSDELLLSHQGRVSLPIQISPGSIGTTATASSCSLPTNSDRESEAAAGLMLENPEIVLRVTHQIGLRWARRAMEAAKIATRSMNPRSVTSKEGYRHVSASAHVVYMTNAEGATRKRHAPVAPSDSIPLKAFDDAVELIYASLPACCPNTPTLVVAPVSDVGVRVGTAWVGPQVDARHAIVAYRPAQAAGGNGRGGDHVKTAKEVENDPPVEDELFIRNLAAEVEGILREFRAKEMRVEQRRLALSRVREICDTWTCTQIEVDQAAQAARGGEDEHNDSVQLKTLPLFDEQEMSDDEYDDREGTDKDHSSGRARDALYRGFVRALEMALPGVSIYLGLLASGGQTIRYVACSRASSMAGKELLQGEGVSFSCVGPLYAPSIVYPPSGAGGPNNGKRGNRGAHDVDSSMSSQSKEIPACQAWSFQEGNIARARHGPTKHTGAACDGAERAGLKSTTSAEASYRLSPEQGVVQVQSAFRGKLMREWLKRRDESSSSTDGAERDVRSIDSDPYKGGMAAWALAKSVPSIPKIFDVGGQVGWPFVCVPIVGFLGASSIGVVGMDTFDEMGSRHDGSKPEAWVVQMVAEAARPRRVR